MDTELLKTFLEVSRTRHFGRAAESLYLTQSAVSFRIRQLENQLGTHLFTRHRNNIRLTPAGERLLPYAETLINTWLVVKKEVTAALPKNALSIGATALLWESYLNDWLPALYQQQPHLQLEARIAQRQLLLPQLHERQLDLLITSDAPKMDELASHLLGTISLQLFTDQQTAQAISHPYIKLEWGAELNPYEQGLLAGHQEPILTTSSAQLARQLLASTQACAFLPAQWQQEYPQLVAVEPAVLVERPVYAVWLENSDQQALIQQLLKTRPNTAT